MMPATHTLSISGELLLRGFWLYVWRLGRLMMSDEYNLPIPKAAS
jgi:hypothetical protein